MKLTYSTMVGEVFQKYVFEGSTGEVLVAYDAIFGDKEKPDRCEKCGAVMDGVCVCEPEPEVDQGSAESLEMDRVREWRQFYNFIMGKEGGGEPIPYVMAEDSSGNTTDWQGELDKPEPLEMAEDYVERMRRDVREKRAPHPGKVLQEILTGPHKTRWSMAFMLERKTGIGWVYWDEVLLGIKVLTDQAAEALAKVFDKPAEFWLNLQRNYDAQKQTQAERR